MREAKNYIASVISDIKYRNPHEKEFLQAVEEVAHSLALVFEKNTSYMDKNILARICEPERQILFKVPWMDDRGHIQVNRGYRVQFNGAIGPYKGGLRFHPSVNLSIVKFLGFEQIFKNSLTGLPIGGGKGGSDFNPVGRSEREIMEFCQSFMDELYRHIGPSVDVPAGDVGVGSREIGYLFGHYHRLKASFENGAFSGKGLTYGGSLIRPEATGFGVAYFIEEMLREMNTSIEGKDIIMSGFGNVAWGTCLKVSQLGGKVTTLSGPDGYIHDPSGVTGDKKIDFLLKMRASGRDRVEDYAQEFKGVEFIKGRKPWEVKGDLIIPCAVQNDIDLTQAKLITENKATLVCEAANMPCTKEALIHFIVSGTPIGPAKAANAGGVAVSALEMSQNSMRLSWSAEEVDHSLRDIMKRIYRTSSLTAKEYNGNLIDGANISGFLKVADAMIAQGIY